MIESKRTVRGCRVAGPRGTIEWARRVLRAADMWGTVALARCGLTEAEASAAIAAEALRLEPLACQPSDHRVDVTNVLAARGVRYVREGV